MEGSYVLSCRGVDAAGRTQDPLCDDQFNYTGAPLRDYPRGSETYAETDPLSSHYQDTKTDADRDTAEDLRAASLHLSPPAPPHLRPSVSARPPAPPANPSMARLPRLWFRPSEGMGSTQPQLVYVRVTADIETIGGSINLEVEEEAAKKPEVMEKAQWDGLYRAPGSQ
mmetsp:Transcript_41631/g.131354  ORF Transcript_41631/g.131354 Transcript_41631/m.131354 type:complete len:169 (-) Transcript_41631:351-857(-)